MAAQNIPNGLPADLFPLSSLPFYILRDIVEFVGAGDHVNHPEDYGASLVVMLELFPDCEQVIERWFAVRFVHTRSFSHLKYRLAMVLPFHPILTPVHVQVKLIQTRVCRVCNTALFGAFWVEAHYEVAHPEVWLVFGRTLDHNLMPP